MVAFCAVYTAPHSRTGFTAHARLLPRARHRLWFGYYAPRRAAPVYYVLNGCRLYPGRGSHRLVYHTTARSRYARTCMARYLLRYYLHCLTTATLPVYAHTTRFGFCALFIRLRGLPWFTHAPADTRIDLYTRPPTRITPATPTCYPFARFTPRGCVGWLRTAHRFPTVGSLHCYRCALLRLHTTFTPLFVLPLRGSLRFPTKVAFPFVGLPPATAVGSAFWVTWLPRFWFPHRFTHTTPVLLRFSQFTAHAVRVFTGLHTRVTV